MDRINEITYKEIERLTDIQLTKLLLKLLHLEAHVHNISASSVSVPLKITVSDGGEDARIQWDSNMEKTDWIPSKFTIFQCKATYMGVEDCKREILKGSSNTLKSRVEEVLDSGGSYVLFCGKSCKNEHKKPRIEKIREAIRESGKEYADTCDIEIYAADDIANWANQYIPAVVYVCECVGLSLPIGLKTWNIWEKYSQNQTKYFVNGILEGYINSLRTFAGKMKSVIRIVGLSGLGKTRMALEAFRPPEDHDDIEQQSLSDQSVYYDAAFQSKHLPDFVADLCNRKLKGILIIDNCDLALHKRLSEEVKRVDSNLSLVTIDFNPELPHQQYPVIELKPDILKDIIENMLRHLYPTLSEVDIDRISEFAQGFPHMAVLLAEDRLKGAQNIGCLKDSQLLEKLLWGRYERDKDEYNVLSSCAIFNHIGFADEIEFQRKFVAEQICGIDEGDFFKICNKFIERGILQQHGRYITVIPKPLAIRLAVEWWKDCLPEKAKSLLDKVNSAGLAEALCDQMAKLDFLPEAQELTKELCGEQAPFGRAEVLNTEEGSRLFRSLVEVNPQATVAALNHVLGSWNREQLLEVGPGRRNLIWALEKLCFWSDTFPIAAKLMLAFAAAENETWGNNATNQFLQLFHVFLSGTQAPPDQRLLIIEDALKSSVPECRILAIKALGSALETHDFVRMGGIETQGSRVPQEDWRPKYWSEAFEYWEKCIDILTSISCSNEFDDLARQQIAKNIRGLVQYGRADKLEAAVKSIIEKKGPYWPEALEEVKNTISYDVQKMPEDIKARLQEWVEMLTPRALPDKLRSIVTTPPREYEKDSNGNLMVVSKKNAVALADEIEASGESWYEYLPIILQGQQREGYTFGRRLGEITEDPEIFISHAIKHLSEIPQEEANPYVLAGFLATIQDRELASSTLEKISSDEKLYNHIIDLTRLIKPSETDLNRVLSIVNSGKIPVESLHSFAHGSVLSHLSTRIITSFCEKITHYGLEGHWCALNILFLHCFGDENRWAASKDLFRSILLADGLLLKNGQSFHPETYYWEETAKKLLTSEEKDIELAEHIAEDIVFSCKQRNFSPYVDYTVQPILEILLTRYLDISWPTISECLLSDDWRTVFNLTHLLSPRIGGDGGSGVLSVVDSDFLFRWCKDNSPKAPTVISRIMPLFSKEGDSCTWHPFAKSIIDNFGSIKEVLSEISANMGSCGGWGSLIPHYQQRVSLMDELKNHPLPEVRQWAIGNLEWLNELIRHEVMREEEWDLGIL